MMWPDETTDYPWGKQESWDHTYSLPVPIDRSPATRCPVCHGPAAPKDWMFHIQDEGRSQTPWRCDVRTKCLVCALVLTYGLAISREKFEQNRMAGRVGGRVRWRDAKRILEREGFTQ